ncbi:MAG: hypothetical protein ABL951_04100 [Alphaproteobacteria bacterium]
MQLMLEEMKFEDKYAATLSRVGADELQRARAGAYLQDDALWQLRNQMLARVGKKADTWINAVVNAEIEWRKTNQNPQ